MECPACGNPEATETELRPCPHCGTEKCARCNMGDDVECPACESDDL